MIPTAFNPLGVNRKIRWRNFYDSPKNWTEFNALDLSALGEIELSMIFVPSVNYRANVNAPIFGRYAGDQCPVFASVNSNRIIVYIYSGAGRFIFWGQEAGFIFNAGQENTLFVRLAVGEPATATVNATTRTTSGNYPSFAQPVGTQSSFDGEIHQLKVTSAGQTVWEAPVSDLII